MAEGMAEGLIILKRARGSLDGGAMGQWHGFGQCRVSLAWLFATLLCIMMGVVRRDAGGSSGEMQRRREKKEVNDVQQREGIYQ